MVYVVARRAAGQYRERGDEQRFEGAITSGLELFALTLSDPRWRSRLKELTRAKELFCDAILGGSECR